LTVVVCHCDSDWQSSVMCHCHCDSDWQQSCFDVVCWWLMWRHRELVVLQHRCFVMFL